MTRREGNVHPEVPELRDGEAARRGPAGEDLADPDLPGGADGRVVQAGLVGADGEEEAGVEVVRARPVEEEGGDGAGPARRRPAARGPPEEGAGEGGGLGYVHVDSAWKG